MTRVAVLRLTSKHSAQGLRAVPIKNLTYLHMPPLATISGGDLSSIELSGLGVTGRPDIPNDRQSAG
jgi:hypothetical protein